MKTLIFSILVFLSSMAFAAQYKYNELVIKDYDEMSKVVNSRVTTARKLSRTSEEGDDDERTAVEHLREALKLIFSRPNSDNMVAKLTPEVRRELIGFSAFEDTIASLAKEGIDALDNKHLSKNSRATYLFLLENLMSEIRPEVESNGNDALRKAVEKIRDAKIKVSKDVQVERSMGSMFQPFDPSGEAKKILETADKAKKKEDKAKK